MMVRHPDVAHGSRVGHLVWVMEMLTAPQLKAGMLVSIHYTGCRHACRSSDVSLVLLVLGEGDVGHELCIARLMS